MKKIFIILLMTILFIPYVVNAKESIYIDSIELDEIQGDAIELEEATANDKTVNLNLRMSNKNDEVKYKLDIKNETEEDYEINKNNISINSDYIDYSLESDNNKIIKANTSKTVYLRVKYSNEVDQSKFVNGVYQDNITMKLNLRTNDDIPNPNTGLPYLIIISLILIISGISLIVFKKKKLSTLTILIGIILLLIGVKALNSYEIIVDSKVTIKTEDTFKLFNMRCNDVESTYEYTYRIGMSLNNYYQSNYYQSLDSDYKEKINFLRNFFGNENEEYFIEDNALLVNEEFFTCYNSIEWPNSSDYQNYSEYLEATSITSQQANECLNQHSKEISLNEKIHNASEGTYLAKEASCLG